MRSKVRGMRVPPELCFYFISVPRLLITKSAKLKDAGAERLVAAPAGKSLCIFYFFWCGVAPSSEHLAQRRRSAWRLLTRPFRSLLIRASQLETTLILCSNQPSSVIFRRLHSGLYPASTFGLYKTTPTEQLLGERDDTCVACVCMMFFLGGVFAICARSWPCDAIVMRGSGIFHLSLAAWLAANGLCLTWFNPPSLQSAITYEMTTVSHPVSHLPWFHTSQQPNHSCEINERRWGVVGDSLITPAHSVM